MCGTGWPPSDQSFILVYEVKVVGFGKINKRKVQVRYLVDEVLQEVLPTHLLQLEAATRLPLTIPAPGFGELATDCTDWAGETDKGFLSEGSDRPASISQKPRPVNANKKNKKGLAPKDHFGEALKLGKKADVQEVTVEDLAGFSKADLLGVLAALNHPAPNKGVAMEALQGQILAFLAAGGRLTSVFPLSTSNLTFEVPLRVLVPVPELLCTSTSSK